MRGATLKASKNSDRKSRIRLRNLSLHAYWTTLDNFQSLTAWSIHVCGGRAAFSAMLTLWLWLAWFDMDHPTLPVVGKNFELVCDRHFNLLEQILLLPLLQNYVQANSCLYLFVCAVSILNYLKRSWSFQFWYE